MKDIIPAKKQSPILGLSGMGGGVGSNLGGSLAGPSYIDEVFSTYLYRGDGGSSRSINNGIDLAGEGGLVWIKSRTTSYSNALYDTARGAGTSKSLISDMTAVEGSYPTLINLSSFNNNGFTIGSTSSTNILNDSGNDFTSWTFRKQKGFCDIVTYTGTGSALTINHSLGSIPGMIIVKCTTAVKSWVVYHRNLNGGVNPEQYAMFLNSDSTQSQNIGYWNNTAPTATQFTLGDSAANENGETHVAYVFAGGESNAATARSVDFDGSGDTLSIPNNALFNDIDGVDFTMECYAKFDSHGSHDGIIHNVTNSGWGGGSWVFEPVGGNLYFYYYNASSTANIAGGPIPVGQWQHMAITKSGRTITIYQDGIKTGSGNISGNIRTATNPLLIGGQCVGRDMDGKVSNVRITIGQVLYTSSFKPPTEPLTTTSQGATASNVKLLCCNNSSVTGSTVTTGTITTNGDPAASTDSPFDDPQGFQFGEEGDQNTIKCGSYITDASEDATINLGWEPQWLLVKRYDGSSPWMILDTMRGLSNAQDIQANAGGQCKVLEADDYVAENSTNRLGVESTGFYADQYGANRSFVYMAIRRPDGYVGKPAEAATDLFAMDVGPGSGTGFPVFESGFPVDWALMKVWNSSGSWYPGARLIQTKYLETDTTSAEGGNNQWVFDFNVGWNRDSSSFNNSNHQSWMWKRHAGFDVVTYKGNGVQGREIPHSLNNIPEMIVCKKRNASGGWQTYHVGTGPTKYLYWDTDAAAGTHSAVWADTTPTKNVFTVGSGAETNNNNDNFIALLFASVEGISKVGYYTGTGNNQSVTTGFQPRFILIKRTSYAEDWFIFDSLRGLVSGSPDPYLRPNQSAGQSTTASFFDISSTGFTVTANFTNNANNYIYYAHA